MSPTGPSPRWANGFQATAAGLAVAGLFCGLACLGGRKNRGEPAT